ncbi:MAG TPA: tyrosine-type recombinase/integrase [Pseudonocardiaceae bacterium]|jgi:site-specific recombinase XerD|nr:tyrosine-type recombinase/integrase [Pseudonocardiaceae bacterium]
MTALAPILEGFFTDYLMTQRRASPHTIASYRDTFKLLLTWLRQSNGKLPAQLDLSDLDAPTIADFLQQLETSRGNSPLTRNVRLTAIHSLFRFAALRAPEHTALIARVLAVQSKRADKTLVSFLSRTELEALLAAPSRATWHGRRDHALILLAAQTGLRVSELTALPIGNVHLGAGAHVRCMGKGRKERCTPLTEQTVQTLTAWLAERRGGDEEPVFCTRAGDALSRDAVARLLTKHTAIAAEQCPSLLAKTVTPHTLRHSAAMALLHAGVDITVIALWLGHTSPETSRIYLHADMALKEKALARTPPNTTPGRYTAPDTLLTFLQQL